MDRLLNPETVGIIGALLQPLVFKELCSYVDTGALKSEQVVRDYVVARCATDDPVQQAINDTGIGRVNWTAVFEAYTTARGESPERAMATLNVSETTPNAETYDLGDLNIDDPAECAAHIARLFNVEGKRIASPGKFEGEPLYAPFYWAVLMGGMPDDEVEGLAVFDVTAAEHHVWPELAGVDHVLLSEDGNGFVRTRAVTAQELEGIASSGDPGECQVTHLGRPILLDPDTGAFSTGDGA